MSLENIDLAALDRDLQDFARQQQRGWFRRNWLWFVPTLFLIMVILCCGCLSGIFYFALGALYDSEVFKTAMAKIEADDTVRQALGQPIARAAWPLPAGRIEIQNDRGEADIRWEVEGPKGRGKAHVQARLTNNQWDLVILEVVLPDGKKVSLLDGEGDVAPPWPPAGTKREEKKADGGGKPPEIELPPVPE